MNVESESLLVAIDLNFDPNCDRSCKLGPFYMSKKFRINYNQNQNNNYVNKYNNNYNISIFFLLLFCTWIEFVSN